MKSNHNPSLEPESRTIDQMADDMITDDLPLVGWDLQYTAVAELMEPEDIALLLLATMSGDRLTAMQVAAQYEDRVLAVHKRLLEQSIERNGMRAEG